MRSTITRPRWRDGTSILVAALVLLATRGAPEATGQTRAGDPVEATAAATPVSAALPATAPTAAPSALLPDLPAISLDLALVSVDSPALRAAATRYADVAARQASAQHQRAGIDQRWTELTARATRLRTSATSATSRVAGLRDRLEQIDAAIATVAVHAFVEGTDRARIDAALTSETPAVSDGDRRGVMGRASMDVLVAERAAHLAEIEAATARADAAHAELSEVQDALAALLAARPGAVDREATTGAAVAEERVGYEQARVLAKVDGVDFQLVALDAYHRAARRVRQERPGCSLQWWGLAGISRVEGHHGTYRGNALTHTGDLARPMIGIRLDGTNGTRAIRDSDGGALDGDPYFDRAVGPMQFIPQTWRRFGADGNGDWVVSPFNIYDATLAAAHYLCTASGRLDSDDGLRTAYLSYNHSLAYAENVLGHARLYAHLLRLPA